MTTNEDDKKKPAAAKKVVVWDTGYAYIAGPGAMTLKEPGKSQQDPSALEELRDGIPAYVETEEQAFRVYRCRLLSLGRELKLLREPLRSAHAALDRLLGPTLTPLEKAFMSMPAEEAFKNVPR